MRPEELEKLLRRQPFQPFRLFLSNGKSFDIRHPEMALLTKTAVLIGRSPSELPTILFEDWDIVTLLHINNIEPLSVVPPPSANGPAQSP